MISDTLFEAAEEIRNYLTDATFRDAYQGETRARIDRLLDEMRALRLALDAPPDRKVVQPQPDDNFYRNDYDNPKVWARCMDCSEPLAIVVDHFVIHDSDENILLYCAACEKANGVERKPGTGPEPVAWGGGK